MEGTFERTGLEMFSFPPLVQLTSLLAAMILIGGPSSCRAQIPLPILPPSEQSEVEDAAFVTLPEISGQQVLPIPAPVVNGMPTATACDNGYWLVTAHYSPQSFKKTCPLFRPGVARYVACEGGYRRAPFEELKASLIPGVPVCVFVHGSFVDLPYACKEAARTWTYLKGAGCGQQMQMIMFYWPSYKGFALSTPIDVNLLGRQAARNGYYLAELMQHIPPECPVCLIGHSHGTRVVASSLHLMAGGAIQGIAHPFARSNGRRIRTILVASALDHDWLNPGHKYDRALCSTECVLNMYNSRDSALKVYPFRLPLIARRALGARGLSRSDRMKLGAEGQKIFEYDVAMVTGKEHIWPAYFQGTKIASLIRPYIYFDDPASIEMGEARVSAPMSQTATSARAGYFSQH